MEATENLDQRYIIGRGAHGVVFKASLSPDKVYALKKLAFGAYKGGKSSIVREIQTMRTLRHRNLVKLEDFWLRKDYGLLLYRYMENGSLCDVLHEKSPRLSLEWKVRYKIAVGTAHGLAYLHFDCNPAVIHRDIKPENILLDSDMEPRISDFGIAKLLDHSASAAPSMAVAGTVGYMAPENAFMTKMSRESDVYSYGVVLLELLTRQKAVDPSFTDSDIVGWARSVWSSTRDINRIVDPSLAEEFLDTNIMEQVADVVLVALRCTEKEPSRRPNMIDVVNQLLKANVPQRNKRSLV